MASARPAKECFGVESRNCARRKFRVPGGAAEFFASCCESFLRLNEVCRSSSTGDADLVIRYSAGSWCCPSFGRGGVRRGPRRATEPVHDRDLRLSTQEHLPASLGGDISQRESVGDDGFWCGSFYEHAVRKDRRRHGTHIVDGDRVPAPSRGCTSPTTSGERPRCGSASISSSFRRTGFQFHSEEGSGRAAILEGVDAFVLEGVLGSRSQERSSRLYVLPPAVTRLSCIASSKAAWVLAGARLISSASKKFVNTAPRSKMNSTCAVIRPRISVGVVSAVNWTRLNCTPSTRATALERSVLAVPGAPFRRTCPPQGAAISRSSTAFLRPRPP